MSIMVAGLYEALRNAGTKDALARKAAEEVAQFEIHIHEVKSDLKLLKWLVGFNLAMTMAALFHLLG